MADDKYGEIAWGPTSYGDAPQEQEKLTPRGVRPASAEDLEEWKAAAKAQGTSLHKFMLFAVRDWVARTNRGERIPREVVTESRIKMPGSEEGES